MDATQTGPKWASMTPRQFDTKAPAQTLSLFPELDPYGTPDMFAEQEEQDREAALHQRQPDKFGTSDLFSDLDGQP